MHPSTPTPPHFAEPRWEFTKRMELSREEHVRLKDHSEERGLLFFSSPFSVEAVDLLEEIGNPLLQDRLRRGHESAAARGRRGDGQAGTPLDRDGRARRRRARARGAEGRRCGRAPRPPVHVHATRPAGEGQPARDGGDGRAVRPPVRALGPHAGHLHLDRAPSPSGPTAIEKHFTLSKRLYGPDHHASLTPEELARLVEGVRQVEAALGRPEKERDPALDPARATFEKSVVSRGAIAAGTQIEREMLTTKRPGNGIPAIRLAEVVGRRAARAIPANARARGRPTLPERRKICVVVASRANYARDQDGARRRSQAHPELELQVVAGRLARARALRQRRRRDVDGRLQARRDDPVHHRGRDARDDGEVDRPRAPRAADGVRAAQARRRRHGRRPLRDDRDRDRRGVHEHPGRAHAGRRGLRLDRRERPPRGHEARAPPLPGDRALRPARDRDGRGPGHRLQRRLPLDRPRRGDRPRPRARTRSRTSAAPAPRSIRSGRSC